MSKCKLSKREKEVLDLLSKGYTAKEVAVVLYISLDTVISHRISIKNKLKARNTAHMISISYQEGLLYHGQVA